MPAEPFIVFAGGGSGGHLFPALTIATELRTLSPEARLLFVGSSKAIDQVITHAAGLEFVSLCGPTATDLWRRPWSSWPNLWRSYRQAFRLLQERRPTVVLATGGYASVPVGLAAARLGIPLTLLEPNAVAGRATSLLARLAREIYVGTPGQQIGFGARCIHTGTPVRREIAELIEIPVSEDRRTLLILGGSQGARDLNTAISNVLLELRPWEQGWQVLHQTGTADVDRVRQVYGGQNSPVEVVPFLQDMPTAYRRSGAAISRAGAVTLAELSCVGIPALVWPHPTAVRQHQLRNAEQFVRSGGGVLIKASTVTEAVAQFRLYVPQLLSSSAGPTEREQFPESAASDIVGRLLALSQGKTGTDDASHDQC